MRGAPYRDMPRGKRGRHTRPARPGRRWRGSDQVWAWRWCGRRRASGAAVLRAPNRPRALEVGRSIDTERNSVNERHIDAHAGFEGAKLLQLFAPFQDSGGQGHESLQRRAAISIKPDMMIVIPFT